MNIHTFLGYLSVAVFAAGYVPYIISILRGKTTPHPFSWLLWTVLGFVSFFLYVHVGAKETLPLALGNCILPFVVVVLSLRSWRVKFSRFDYACLALSFFSIVLYAFLRDAILALTFNLAADLLAFLPTIRKAYKQPESEDMSTWILFTVGYALSLFAIVTWTYGVAVFPLYFTTLGTLMCLILLRARLKKAA